MAFDLTRGGSTPLSRWMGAWLRFASQRSVLRRAFVTCLFVGVLLTVVNHGPELVRAQFSPGLVAQIALTLLIPFAVSVVSSVGAIQEHLRRQQPSDVGTKE